MPAALTVTELTSTFSPREFKIDSHHVVWDHSSCPVILFSLSFNSWCTSPPTVWKPCKSRGWRSRPDPHYATFGPSPCSDPPGMSIGPQMPTTRTTLSGRGRTGTGLIREVESSWCSWCVWAGSSSRAARGLVSATTPPAGRRPEPEPPSRCKCLSGCQWGELVQVYYDIKY